MPNKSITDKPLNNLNLRTAQRVGFMLVVDQRTASDQRQATIDGLVASTQTYSLVTKDVQMKFNTFSLSGEEVIVQYFVDTTSYADYLDVKERVNYYLVQAAEHHGGSFASTSAPLPVQVSAGSDAS